MLCSSCSKPVVPVVACDIDGTLGDYHGHFRQFAEGYLGRRLPLGYDGGGRFNDHLGIERDLYRTIKLAYRQGGMKRTMRAYTGAAKFVAALRAAGAEVWLTTTRPYLRLDNLDPDTREWLARHDINFDGLLYDQDKYKLLAEALDPHRVVAVVDDLAAQYDAAAELFGPNVPILRRTQYNRAITRNHASGDFKHLRIWITERIGRWEGYAGHR